MNEELVINETNFKEYFRDCRNARPERGDVMARWMAKAEFVDGRMKQDVIELLACKDKAIAATKVMQKIGFSTLHDAVRVCKEICKDLDSGMTIEEVEAKAYPYNMEMFYYTKKEYVPKNDPHWSVIGLENLDEFMDAADQKLMIKSRFIDKKDAVIVENYVEAIDD